jgi:hypothetical protein
MPNSIIKSVEFSEEEAYQRIDTITRNVNNRLVELEKALAASEESIVTAVDEHYHRTEKTISNLNEKLRKLPKIEDKTMLPYNIDQMLKLADQIERFTPEQWERLKELMTIFAPSKQS